MGEAPGDGLRVPGRPGRAVVRGGAAGPRGVLHARRRAPGDGRARAAACRPTCATCCGGSPRTSPPSATGAACGRSTGTTGPLTPTTGTTRTSGTTCRRTSTSSTPRTACSSGRAIQAYLRDPAFSNFYDRTVTDYVQRWSLGVDAVMKRPRLMNRAAAPDPDARFANARGIPGYNEDTDDFVAGLDLLAAQYAGFAAYARIQEARGDVARGAHVAAEGDGGEGVRQQHLVGREDAELLRPPDHRLHARASRGRPPGTPRRSTGRSPPTASTSGPRWTASSCRLASRAPRRSRSSRTTPKCCTASGRPTSPTTRSWTCRVPTARAASTRRCRSRSWARSSPGLMGVSVDPVMPGREGDLLEYFANQFVMTLPQLTPRTAWAELRHLPVRANDVSVRHEGVDGDGLHQQQRPGPRLARGAPRTVRRARRQRRPREGLTAGAAARPRRQLRARGGRAGHQRASRGARGYSAVIGQITDFTSEMRLAGKPPAGVFADQGLVRRDVDTVDLVVGHEALEPLNLRPDPRITSHDFCASQVSCWPVSAPAPGSSRSIRYFGTIVSSLDGVSSRRRPPTRVAQASRLPSPGRRGPAPFLVWDSRPSSIASGPRAFSRAGSSLPRLREHGLRPSPNQTVLQSGAFRQGAPPTVTNTRRYPRFPVGSFKLNGQMTYASEVSVIDIGMGGVSLTADKRLNIGAKYQLKLEGDEQRGLGDLRSGVVEDERHQEVGRRRVRPGLHRRDEIRRRVARKSLPCS